MLFAVSLFANALGLNISSAFKSAVTIYIIIPFLIIPQLLLSGLLVKFDELNPSLAAKSIVPKSGEIMASRWAFEALVVNQFMNNKYEKNVYPKEKEIINASYLKGLWYNKMLDLLDNKDAISINILNNELAKMGYSSVSNNQTDRESVKQFLDRFKKKQIDIFKSNTSLLDNYFVEKANTDEQKLQMEQVKMDFHNQRIEELVKNSRPLEDGIYAEAGYLHPNENNVYFDASSKHQIRSHFYTPKKFFAGKYYSTYLVNLFVILAMTIICFVALYYNLLKKLINGIQDLAFKLKLTKG
jgi:hypothetical protein